MNGLKKMSDKALSGREVLRLVGGNANVMNYRQLKKYDNINDALGSHGALVLLYESEINFGHWTLVFRAPDGVIEHFDSYGYKPDQELMQIPEKFKKKYYDGIPHLTYLLYKCEEPIRFSQYALQGKNTNTCGRWVAIRLLSRDINENEFKKLMTIGIKPINPDLFVTMVTELILNNSI